jgi:hypothetical protein
MRRHAFRRTIPFSTCIALAPAVLAANPYVHPVALGGQQAANAPDGFFYALFFTPGSAVRDLVINQNDQILTDLIVADRNDTNHTEFVLYSGSSASSFTPFLRSAIEIPNQPGVFPKDYGQFNISKNGNVIVNCDLQGAAVATSNNIGVLAGTSPADMKIIARKGDPIADLPGFNHLTIFFPVMNDSGLIATGFVMGGATNSANDSGVFVRRPTDTDFHPLIHESDFTPDNPGQQFAQTTSSRVNNSGTFLVLAGLAGAGINSSNNASFYLGDSPNTLTRIAQTNDQAPGLAAGIKYASFSSTAYTMNHAGTIAFRAGLSSSNAGQVTTANDSAIFVAPPSGGPPAFSVFVREGDPAPIPGVANANYSGTLNFALAGNDTLVFSCNLANRNFNNDSALFTGSSPTNLVAIAIEGQQARGAPAGATYNNDSTTSSAFSNFSVNASGQIIFLAQLKYAGSSTVQKGLYYYDPVQGVVLLTRTGDTLDINGSNRAITDLLIGASGNGEDGQGSPMNNNGAVVFQITGSGFSGIFTANVPLIGDTNLDGKVNFADFQRLELGFGATGAERIQGDLNGDGQVDTADFRLLYNNYGHTLAGLAPIPAAEAQALAAFAATVPEPTTTALFLIPLLSRRRPRPKQV